MSGYVTSAAEGQSQLVKVAVALRGCSVRVPALSVFQQWLAGAGAGATERLKLNWTPPNGGPRLVNTALRDNPVVLHACFFND